MKRVSMVIPLFKSDKHIYLLLNKINTSSLVKTFQINLVLIIDGCTREYDIEKIETITKNFSYTAIYLLNKNFGQYIATIEGLKIASNLSSVKIITLDCDCYNIDDWEDKLNRGISLKYDIIYFEISKNRSNILRSLGSYLFKKVLFMKTNFKVFKNGSSIRFIEPNYLNSLIDQLLVPEKLDVYLLKNTSNYYFIEVEIIYFSTSYNFLKLVNTLAKFIFNFKTENNIKPILLKEFKNDNY